MGKARSDPAPRRSSSVHQLDINQATNNIIVANEQLLVQVQLSGKPVAFSALAPTTTELGTDQPELLLRRRRGRQLRRRRRGGRRRTGPHLRESEGESKVVAWKANGEPMSGGFAPPNGVERQLALRNGRRLRRRRLGGELRQPSPDRVQPERNRRPAPRSTSGSPTARWRSTTTETSTSATTAAKGYLQIQPDWHETRPSSKPNGDEPRRHRNRQHRWPRLHSPLRMDQ